MQLCSLSCSDSFACPRNTLLYLTSVEVVEYVERKDELVKEVSEEMHEGEILPGVGVDCTNVGMLCWLNMSGEVLNRIVLGIS